MSTTFGKPSGFDYATYTDAASWLEFWVSMDVAFNQNQINSLGPSAANVNNFAEFPPGNVPLQTPPNSESAMAIGSPFAPPGVPVGWQVEGRSYLSGFLDTVSAFHWYHLDIHYKYDNATLTFSPELFVDGVNQGISSGGYPAAVSGARNFYFGTDQIVGGFGDWYTWHRNIKIGTTKGGSEIADLSSKASLDAMVAAGVGDNPALSLSVLTHNPF